MIESVICSIVEGIPFWTPYILTCWLLAALLPELPLLLRHFDLIDLLRRFLRIPIATFMFTDAG